MVHHFDTAREIGAEFKRIGHSELALALAEAERLREPGPRALHRCRKTIKRLRALIRLAVTVGPYEWKPVDRHLRAAGRALSDLRDADVAVQMAASLSTTDGAGTLLSALEAERSRDVTKAVRAAERELRGVDAKLDDLIDRNRSWSPNDLADAATKAFARCRKSMARYRKSGLEKHAHSWRKHVQRHENQMRLLEQLRPDQLGPRSERLHDLATTLGELHDLTILRQALAATGKKTRKNEAKALLATASARQRELGRVALEIATPLFVEGDGEFCAMLIDDSQHREYRVGS
jgi:CHAD domain-containing protein